MPKIIPPPPSDQSKCNLDYEHGTHEAFFRYYSEQSLEARTRERFLALREMVCRQIESGKKIALDVADIGCGAGTLSQLWAELGHQVYGLDVNAPLIELAQQRANEKNLHIDFQIGSATDLPWSDQSMDVCLVPELLEHIAQWEICLDEFSRILRPGGVLYISTTNRLCPIQEEFNLPLYSWYPAPLKRYYERLAVTDRPEIANYAKYPAVNWFTFYSLRAALDRRGLTAKDRFDVMDLSKKSAAQRLLVGLIRTLPPLRFLAQFATSYLAVIAIKR